MATSRSISLAQMLNCAQLTNPPSQRDESAHAWTEFSARTTLHRLTCSDDISHHAELLNLAHTP
jgi:hypothetical protein